MIGLLDIAVMVLIGAGGLAALASLINIIRGTRSTAKPGVQAILNALEPYAMRGVLAAEKLALQGLDQIKVTLEGKDKKAIADSVYDALPDYLLVGPVPLPIQVVKYLVPRDRFEVLVEDVYSAADAFITKNEAFLKKQVDILIPSAAVGGGLA